MRADSQVVVPEAFRALFVEPGRHRLRFSHDEIARQHELCEDLALALTDRARVALWQHEASETEVLLGVFRGLRRPDAGLSPPEAAWVTRRLAELLDWAQPTLTEHD